MFNRDHDRKILGWLPIPREVSNWPIARRTRKDVDGILPGSRGPRDLYNNCVLACEVKGIGAIGLRGRVALGKENRRWLVIWHLAIFSVEDYCP